MAVATTSTWNMDADEIIDAAIARCGGEDVTGYDARSAMRNLRLVLQELQIRGLNLWTVEFASFFLTPDVNEYELPLVAVDLLEPVTRYQQTDLIVSRMARDFWAAIPDKETARGRPYQVYVDRQRERPIIHVYPKPDRADYEFRYYYIKRFLDTPAMTNNIDAPVRWLPAVIAGLAYYMARERPGAIDIARLQMLKGDWEELFQIAADEDRDRSPLRIAPDLGVYQGF